MIYGRAICGAIAAQSACAVVVMDQSVWRTVLLCFVGVCTFLALYGPKSEEE